jgi:hypothetical protein
VRVIVSACVGQMGAAGTGGRAVADAHTRASGCVCFCFDFDFVLFCVCFVLFWQFAWLKAGGLGC